MNGAIHHTELSPGVEEPHPRLGLTHIRNGWVFETKKEYGKLVSGIRPVGIPVERWKNQLNCKKDQT